MSDKKQPPLYDPLRVPLVASSVGKGGGAPGKGQEASAPVLDLFFQVKSLDGSPCLTRPLI